MSLTHKISIRVAVVSRLQHMINSRTPQARLFKAKVAGKFGYQVRE
uniref:Uncharacterized protein n=1 Tax=Rhizophora mucronata TaxID=61149 RepID=A0A2P2IQ21_RHIMU